MVESEIKSILSKIEDYNSTNSKQCLNCLKWIDKLLKYAINEKNYKNRRKKYWAFSRGSIVKVDFGFNVGYELGGVHYAIILSKEDSVNSGLVTVLPLTSKKKKSVNKYEVDLGDEFFSIVDEKESATLRSIQIYELYENKIELELIEFEKEFGQTFQIFDLDIKNRYSSLSLMLVDNKTEEYNIEMLRQRAHGYKEFYYESLYAFRELHKELSFMKSGTIAKVDQIKVISKERIINPTKKKHALNNIKLFDATMDRINEKIKELIIYN